MLFSKLTKIKCNVKFWITFTEIGIASTRWTTDMIMPINYMMHQYKCPLTKNKKNKDYKWRTDYIEKLVLIYLSTYQIFLQAYETTFIQLMFFVCCSSIWSVRLKGWKLKPITMGIRMIHPKNILWHALQYPINKRNLNELYYSLQWRRASVNSRILWGFC